MKQTKNKLPETAVIKESSLSGSFSDTPLPEDGLLQSDVANNPAPEDKMPASAEQKNRSHLVRRLSLATIIVIAFLLLSASGYNRFQRSNKDNADNVKEQGIDLSQADGAGDLSILDLQGQEKKLVVGGDVIIQGTLRIQSGQYYGQLLVATLSADRDYIFPDASGVVCLDTTCVDTTNIQGTPNQVNVAKNGDTFTLSTPQNIATTSSPSFNSITLANAGLQAGSTICDASNNCGYVPGAVGFIQNGNSFGTTAILGTNDNFALQFETDGVTRATIDEFGLTSLFGNTDNYGDLWVGLDADIDGHLALGNGASVSTSYVLNLQETTTDSYIQGIVNYITYDPSSGGGTVYGLDTEIFTPSSNSNYISSLNGTFTGVYHDGSGYVSEMVGSHIDLQGWGGGVQYSTGQILEVYGNTSYDSLGQFIDIYSEGSLFSGNQDNLNGQNITIDFEGSGVADSAIGQDIFITSNAGEITNAIGQNIFMNPYSDSSIGQAILIHAWGDYALGVQDEVYGSSINVLAQSGVAVTDAYGQEISLATCSGGRRRRGGGGRCSSSIENAYGVFIANESKGRGGITNNYSLYIANPNIGGTTTNYGIFIEPQQGGDQDVGIAVGASDYQTLWLANDDDYDTPEAGIAFGASRDTNLFRGDVGTLATDAQRLVFDYTNGSENEAIGWGSYNNTGFDNNSFGVAALDDNIGDYNNAIGYSALSGGNSGSYNNALGYGSLSDNIFGSNNNGIGFYSLYGNSGNENNSLGSEALSDNVGDYNNAIGYQAGYGSMGSYNLFLGYQAGQLNTSSEQLIIKGSSANNLIAGDFALNALNFNADVGVFQNVTDSTSAFNVQDTGSNKILNIDTTNQGVDVGTLTTDDITGKLTVSTGTTTGKGIIVQGIAAQTANLQEWQSSTGTLLASISASGDLTVVNGTVNGNLSVNGHIITGGGSTSFTNNVPGAVASIVVSGTDTAGKVTIITTGAPASGEQAQINFATFYSGGSEPVVVLTPADSNGASIQYYVDLSGASSFKISSGTVPAAATTYTYYYHVLE